MVELDQPDYIFLKRRKSVYQVNGELFSCGITYSSRVPSRGGDIQNFTISPVRFWIIIQICSKFYCWVCKIAFYSPNQNVVWGNFPFKRFTGSEQDQFHIPNPNFFILRTWVHWGGGGGHFAPPPLRSRQLMDRLTWKLAQS